MQGRDDTLLSDVYLDCYQYREDLKLREHPDCSSSVMTRLLWPRRNVFEAVASSDVARDLWDTARWMNAISWIY